MNRFAILGALGVAVIVAALLLNYVINRDELGDTGTPAPVVSTTPSGSTTAPSGGSSGETQGAPAQGSTSQGSATQGSTTQGSAGAGAAAQGSVAQGSTTQGSAPSQASTDQGSTGQSTTGQGTANQGTASGGGTAMQNAPAQNSTTGSTTTQGTTGQATSGQGQAATAGGTTAPATGGQVSAPASSGEAGTQTQSSTGGSTGAAAPSASNAPAATQTANAAPAGGTAASEPPPVRPSFDIVRVTPDGGTVIAGRAAPHATVTITADGQKIGAVVADDRGEWVILPTSKLVPGNHQIAIASQLGTAPPVASDDVVIVVVPQPPVAGQTKATGEGTQTAQATTPPQQPLAVVVPRTDQGSSTVLQSPNPPQSGQLVLQSVDYDAEGRVVIGGRAGPGKEVRAYLDNQLVGKVKADQSGVWHITPDHHVMPGLHTLRIDEVDENGKVLARVESPFSRAEPLSIDAGDQVVVVQPGNNLWLIATHTYGSGPRYTVIYQANKSQIKNPDLIYPGQVFKLPMDAP